MVTSAGTAYNATAYASGPGGMPVHIGDVTINGYQLDTAFAGFYSLSSNNSSLNLSSDNVTWSATGGNGYPSFVQEANDVSFPAGGTINSDGPVVKSAPYTFSWTAVSGADSVRFDLGYGVSRMLPGDATSFTFTVAQMANLPTGSTYATISAIAYQSNTIEGKRHQFSKQHTAAAALTVVD